MKLDPVKKTDRQVQQPTEKKTWIFDSVRVYF